MKKNSKTTVKTGKIHTSIRLDPDIIKVIEKLAERPGESQNSIIEKALAISLGVWSQEPLPIKANIKIP
jgi:Ribbon-helix-helix protein, copG family